MKYREPHVVLQESVRAARMCEAETMFHACWLRCLTVHEGEGGGVEGVVEGFVGYVVTRESMKGVLEGCRLQKRSPLP